MQELNKANYHCLKLEETSADSTGSSCLAALEDTIVVGDAEEKIAAARSREVFKARLLEIPGPAVTLSHEIDNASPSLGFRFIEESIICSGVTKASKESVRL
jgi:hypothetical protein